jgi:hypothetical protein
MSPSPASERCPFPRDCDDIWCPEHSPLASAKIQFWMCPIEEHAHRYPEPIRETVRWIDNVAHCMEPGCGRTSAD